LICVQFEKLKRLSTSTPRIDEDRVAGLSIWSHDQCVMVPQRFKDYSKTVQRLDKRLFSD
jgi:hypothetical protein